MKRIIIMLITLCLKKNYKNLMNMMILFYIISLIIIYVVLCLCILCYNVIKKYYRNNRIIKKLRIYILIMQLIYMVNLKLKKKKIFFIQLMYFFLVCVVYVQSYYKLFFRRKKIKNLKMIFFNMKKEYIYAKIIENKRL